MKDIVKQVNVVKATSYDYNCNQIVDANDRRKMSKMLNRYSRRKLKQELNKDI